MNISKYLLSIALFANNYSCDSQSISKEDIYDLHGLIGVYLIDNDTLFEERKRPSEFFTLLLEVDSSGKIHAKHVLTDVETGSKTNLFSEMPISIFKNWQSKGASNKLILIPILYISQDSSPEYLDKMIRRNSAKRISVLDEEENKIYLRMFEYRGPVRLRKGN
jgi:hypothetical protein